MSEFKAYKCRMKVYAKPMTRGEYNNYRGWTIPPDECPNDRGYLIVGGNDKGFEHKYWTPDYVFKQFYRQIEKPF